MRRCFGRHQRNIRRLFILSDGEPIRTSAMMAACYPGRDKLEHWRWGDVARAAHKFGVNIKPGWWAPQRELWQQITGNYSDAADQKSAKEV